MKQDSVRTTVDVPGPIYRRLKAEAAANGRSVRELVLGRSQRPSSGAAAAPGTSAVPADRLVRP